MRQSARPRIKPCVGAYALLLRQCRIICFIFSKMENLIYWIYFLIIWNDSIIWNDETIRVRFQKKICKNISVKGSVCWFYQSKKIQLKKRFHQSRKLVFHTPNSRFPSHKSEKKMEKIVEHIEHMFCITHWSHWLFALRYLFHAFFTLSSPSFLIYHFTKLFSVFIQKKRISIFKFILYAYKLENIKL